MFRATCWSDTPRSLASSRPETPKSSILERPFGATQLAFAFTTTFVVIPGIEARGFLFGPPIALAIGAKFVPLPKPKKLPGETIFEEYELEYGNDRLEMHVGAVEAGDRALVVDDLIATGGTLCAAINLLERVGAEVVECACVIELPELQGRQRLKGKPLCMLVEYR
ncbi:BnaC03g65030D [Brassica napus]|uniref:adenine phosphoribosyltransferase n=1 Tax=Brassica napus TaxID=3708 RepID=A0A078HWI6_BRANA|nr:BnaC03g65030D [Brassica napus]